VISYKHYNLAQSRELTKKIFNFEQKRKLDEIYGLNLGFRDLRFNLRIMIFDLRIKMIIFYFHFSTCDTSYTPHHQLTKVFNVRD